MLGTVHIEEASYEGNNQLIMEWFKQLNLHTEDERKRTGLEHVIVWVGDQLTVERLRGLFKYRAQDHTSFDRLDWLVVVFGWFHLMMAFANSMHKQYLGTNAGRGLMHAFTLLEWKGLHTIQTHGPFISSSMMLSIMSLKLTSVIAGESSVGQKILLICDRRSQKIYTN